MTISVFFGTIALISSFIGLLPQVWKAYTTRSTHDVSMIMLLNYAICSIAWLVHGLYDENFFVVWSNGIGLVISLMSIAQKWYYDKHGAHTCA